MRGTILIGSGRSIERVADGEWRRGLEGAPAGIAARLAFMTRDHHRVRNFVVRELPARRAGIRVAAIARELALPAEAVERIVLDLEKHLFFLVRDSGAVRWAYPVTVDRTPHRLRFSTGELTRGA
jgi:hypothetical protein